MAWALKRLRFKHLFEAGQSFLFHFFRFYRMRHLNITNYAETLISQWFRRRIFLFFFLLTRFDQILNPQSSAFPTFALELNCLLFSIVYALLNRLLGLGRKICYRFVLNRLFFDQEKDGRLFLLQEVSNSTSFCQIVDFLLVLNFSSMFPLFLSQSSS